MNKAQVKFRCSSICMFHPSFTKFNLICTVLFALLEGSVCLIGGRGVKEEDQVLPCREWRLGKQTSVICVCVNGLGRIR